MKFATAILIGAVAVVPVSAMADHRDHHRHCHHGHHHKYHHKHYHCHDHRREAGWHGDRRDHGRAADYGRVIDVEPVYRYYREPVSARSCLRVEPQPSGYRSYTATVVGAVVGTALGHRIGDAHGDPKAAAVAGGLLGASLGRDIGHRVRENRQLRVAGPCRVREYEQTRRELVEYEVTYRYNGEVHRARMDYDPGDWVKLDVNVSPT